jgi:hypothetical protein
MVVYNNFEDQPSMLKTEVQAMDSLANNWLDFEMNEINFETFVVGMDVVVAAEVVKIDSD